MSNRTESYAIDITLVRRFQLQCITLDSTSRLTPSWWGEMSICAESYAIGIEHKRFQHPDHQESASTN